VTTTAFIARASAILLPERIAEIEIAGTGGCAHHRARHGADGCTGGQGRAGGKFPEARRILLMSREE
jgi:hypothetical protein